MIMIVMMLQLIYFNVFKQFAVQRKMFQFEKLAILKCASILTAKNISPGGIVNSLSLFWYKKLVFVAREHER